jgi:hypothetical protein
MSDLLGRLMDAAAGMEMLALLLTAIDGEDLRRLSPAGVAVLLALLQHEVTACADALMEAEAA